MLKQATPSAVLPDRGSPTASNAKLPLCVDLDGTLVRGDLLHEAAAGALFADWRNAWRIPLWTLQGRAALKRQLAQRWSFDPARLPYNEELIALVKAERDKGRRIVLTTAADEIIARRVADHLGLFDEIIASDGETNLRGARKATALCDRFGLGGFLYAGNDGSDHAVWEKADGAVVVNATPGVQRKAQARDPECLVIGQRARQLPALLRAMRPYQWVKNVFVLTPMFTSGALRDVDAWMHTLLAVAALCLVASSIYLLNDISDIAADRAHARKRNRPFASGALDVLAGLAAAPLLLAAGAALAVLSGAWISVAVYAVLSLGYTARLKEMPLIDIFILAALYVLRLEAGGEASGHIVSLWLLGFSSFLFLGLALVKRVSELQRQREAGKGRMVARRGYYVQDIEILQMFGVGTAFASAVVLSLYVQSQAAMQIYTRPQLLWALIPLLLFWQCRLWLSTARGYMHDDPIVYAARDWVSWLVFAGIVGSALAAGSG
ncbi:MAG: UbiA family prenyltransferase [Alphaproteobacteria bacterium]|nr:UbiA family prenyltransferase [Alphaproteobacteria bacterium]